MNKKDLKEYFSTHVFDMYGNFFNTFITEFNGSLIHMNTRYWKLLAGEVISNDSKIFYIFSDCLKRDDYKADLFIEKIVKKLNFYLE